jgi:hypothetical protein
MNPSKYILENIEPLDPDDQDVKDMNIGNFPTNVLTENLKKIKDPTRECSGISALNEDNSVVAASEPYEKTEPLILNTTFPNMQYKFVKVEPNKVNFSMIVSGKELSKGAVYDLEKLKDKSFYGELSKWMANESVENDLNESSDIVGKIMSFEGGEMSGDEIIDFFSELITSGQINGLQGMYGRTAKNLIDAGYLDRSGKVLMYTDEGDMDESINNESNINEEGFDKDGNPYGFDRSEYDFYIPEKGDSIDLETGYPGVMSRITYIDPTHIFWKTGTESDLSTGNKSKTITKT